MIVTSVAIVVIVVAAAAIAVTVQCLFGRYEVYRGGYCRSRLMVLKILIGGSVRWLTFLLVEPFVVFVKVYLVTYLPVRLNQE